QPPDRAPQRLLHPLRGRREELERDVDISFADQPAAALLDLLHHAVLSSLCSSPVIASVAAGRRATHSDTVSFPFCEAALGASSRVSTTSAPQSAHHCAICGPAKPKRSCAYSSRRNSSSWGAKSTIMSRPPGESTRTASRTARCGSLMKCSTWCIT